MALIEPTTSAEAVALAKLIYPPLPLHPLDRVHDKQRIHLRHEALPLRAKLKWVSHSLASLKQEGHYHAAISLNLSRAIELQARAHDEQARDWLFRRFQRYLKHAGLQCRFALVIERAIVKDPAERARRRASGLPAFMRLHTHLEAACPSAAFPGVREALLDAAGRWSDEDGYPRESLKAMSRDRRQLKAVEKPDTGWLTRYLLKQAGDYSATSDLKAAARTLYEEYRVGENARRRKKASKAAGERRNKMQNHRRNKKSRDSALAKKSATTTTVKTDCFSPLICNLAEDVPSIAPTSYDVTSARAPCTGMTSIVSSGQTSETSYPPSNR